MAIAGEPDGSPRLRPADTRLWRKALSLAFTRLEAERAGGPYWEGRLSSSALSTAVALSALELAGREAYAGPIAAALGWLERHRNPDGGWGDTSESPSNLSTTTLAVGAMKIARRTPPPEALAYLARFGPLEQAILSAYGDDRTFSAPILMHCALSGMIGWPGVPRLPFALAALPQSLFRFLGLPVVSYALPALIAIGLAKAASETGGGPWRALRLSLAGPALRRLERIQPESGGFLEAAPLTGFVAMGLIAAGRHDHPAVARCIRFLLDGQRQDGSWPIDTNLSVWNTSMAVHALAEDEPAEPPRDVPSWRTPSAAALVRDWLLERQRRTRHPYTGSPPGGWGWSHLSGSVPDADDTAGALLALASLPPAPARPEAARAGVTWLVDLQNRDGGWPTFCRGWGKLPFDRSGCDLTAHVLRGMLRWHPLSPGRLTRRVDRAVRRGFDFLSRTQRADGAWPAMWFGSQATDDQANPVFGTARVLLAYQPSALLGADLWQGPQARRGREYLLSATENAGWGAGRGVPPTLEETAVALEALARAPGAWDSPALRGGADWLARRILAGGLDHPSPIGLYFARLWYDERLYPISLSVSAMRRVLRLSPR